MEPGEVPVIEVSERRWNDDNIAATLDITLPQEVEKIEQTLHFNTMAFCSSEKV